MMPGLDGLSTLNELKRIRPALPVIMITKSEEEGIMNQAIAHRISDYLLKPINPLQIVSALKKLFDSPRLRESQLGEEYAIFVQELNTKLFSFPDFEKWAQIQKELCAWDLEIDNFPDSGLKSTHDFQRQNCNVEFFHYIQNNYSKWLREGYDSPILSVDIVPEYLEPLLEADRNPVFFIVIDCMRYDQMMTFLPILNKYFQIDFMEPYFSVLPTATPYARNALFAGLFPREIAKYLPHFWTPASSNDTSRNRFEKYLLEEQLKRDGYHLEGSVFYSKIFSAAEGYDTLKKIRQFGAFKLYSIVFNFIDLLTHGRSKSEILSDIAADESAFRSLTRSWFEHSDLLEILKHAASQNARVLMTTDHGSIMAKKALKVVGDREATSTIRYKQGRNLKAESKHVLYIKNPEEYQLPSENLVDTYLIAKENYYFVYPNNFSHYQAQYSNSFQHGGISLEEMIIPLLQLTPR